MAKFEKNNNPKNKGLSKYQIKPIIYFNQKEYDRERNRQLRKMALKILGEKCQKCGIIDERVLQIDHIKGGGFAERKIIQTGKKLHIEVIKRYLEKIIENKYQLLCANCNWIKRSENNEIRKIGEK